MPGSVSRESQSNISDVLDASEVGAVGGSNQSNTTKSGATNSVESFQGDGSYVVQAEGGGVSAQELQRQLAAGTQKEKVITDAFASVYRQLEKAIATDGRDVQPFVNAVTSRPEFSRALSTLSREEMQEGLTRLVRDARPELTPAEQKEIVGRLSKHIDEFVLVNSAKRLSERVAQKLEQSAVGFEATAKNPEQVQAIVKHLAKLESLGATNAQKKEAVALRAALGLPQDDRQVTPTALRESLNARAALMRHEGERVFAAGQTTTYRNVMLHSGLNEEFLREAGIKPGSWAARGSEAVIARGESDEHAIERSKQLSAVALAMASGDNRVLNAAAAAAFGSLSVMAAEHELEAARAGLSAGTADLSAEDVAQNKLDVSQKALAASVAIAAVMPHAHGLDDAVNRVAEGVVELSLGQTEAIVEKAKRPEARGVQGDGVTRAQNSAR